MRFMPFALLLLALPLWADVKVTKDPAAPATPTEAAEAPAPQGQPVPEVQTEGTEPAKATEEKPKPEVVALDAKIKVTKVHVVNNTEDYQSGGNAGLDFEKKYWNHGAILESEKEARRGQIYVISWKNSNSPENLKARFEYRQVKTKDQIKSQVVDFAAAQGTKRATFMVVGDEYRTHGPVYSWRFTVLRGDQVVAQERSYIW